MGCVFGVAVVLVVVLVMVVVVGVLVVVLVLVVVVVLLVNVGVVFGNVRLENVIVAIDVFAFVVVPTYYNSEN